MLDENLPTFVLKPSHEKPKQNLTFLFSQWGADFEPMYTVRHPDPEQVTARNRYAVGIYDSYNTDVLYGEVLLTPDWSTPSGVDQEAIKKNGGIPPPPEPLLPLEFIIQLYNPDQQIVVRHRQPTWTKAPAWIFEMPLQTFRTPSYSTLDRSQDDPTGSEVTPKIAFKWKKDSKISNDIVCYLSGKSMDAEGTRKKNKEPDITIAILKNLKEVTLYEPNLQRVDLEDMKGFEVVLLLGAMVIKDVYHGSLKESFNIGSRKMSLSNGVAAAVTTSPAGQPSRVGGAGSPTRDPRVPPTDPRTQWELEAEAAKLRRQVMEEERQRRKKEEIEQQQIKKMLESEEKDRRKKQAEKEAEDAKETARLKKMFGKEDANARPALPPRIVTPQPNTGGFQYHPVQHPHPHPHPAVQAHPHPHPQIVRPQPDYRRQSLNLMPPVQQQHLYAQPQRHTPPQPFTYSNSPWLVTPTQTPVPRPGPIPRPSAVPGASHGGGGGYLAPVQTHPYMSGASASGSQIGFVNHPPAGPNQPQLKPKSSFFGFRRHSEDSAGRLERQRSALF